MFAESVNSVKLIQAEVKTLAERSTINVALWLAFTMARVKLYFFLGNLQGHRIRSSENGMHTKN